MNADEISEVWRRYQENLDRATRDYLINHYIYLVKITSGRLFSKASSGIDRDDLISAGIIGLIKAVDQYDATRKVKFETYAIALIRGAMQELLRDHDWVPRSVRDRLKVLKTTYATLEAQLGRPATDEEMASALNMTLSDFFKLLTDAGRTSILSLEDLLIGGENGETLSIGNIIRDGAMPPPLVAEYQERRQMLAAAVDRLPERERLVIALYYYEGMTFLEISKILTVSESRVYQIYTQAVTRLQSYLLSDQALY